MDKSGMEMCCSFAAWVRLSTDQTATVKYCLNPKQWCVNVCGAFRWLAGGRPCKLTHKTRDLLLARQIRPPNHAASTDPVLESDWMLGRVVEATDFAYARVAPYIPYWYTHTIQPTLDGN